MPSFTIAAMQNAWQQWRALLCLLNTSSEYSSRPSRTESHVIQQVLRFLCSAFGCIPPKDRHHHHLNCFRMDDNSSQCRSHCCPTEELGLVSPHTHEQLHSLLRPRQHQYLISNCRNTWLDLFCECSWVWLLLRICPVLSS